MAEPVSKTTTPPPVRKKSNMSGIIIAILSIIVVIEGVKIWWDYTEKVEIVEQKASVEEDLATTMQRLSEIKAELDQKIVADSMRKLQEDPSLMAAAREDKEVALDRLGLQGIARQAVSAGITMAVPAGIRARMPARASARIERASAA